MNWVRYFLGSPQRLLLTLGGVTVLYALANPSGFQQALGRLMGLVWQLFAFCLVLAVIWHVIRRIIRL